MTKVEYLEAIQRCEFEYNQVKDKAIHIKDDIYEIDGEIYCAEGYYFYKVVGVMSGGGVFTDNSPPYALVK